MDRGRGRLALALCLPPHPVPVAGGSRDALQSLLTESDGSGDILGETATGQLARAPALAPSREERVLGWDFLLLAPTKPVCPATLLAGEVEKLPMLRAPGVLSPS